MKKFLRLLPLLPVCCSLPTQAKTPDLSVCTTFNIYIENASSNDCVLEKYVLSTGALKDKSQLPEVIFRGKKAFFSLTWNYSAKYLLTNLLMTFRCGEDQTFTILSTTPNNFKVPGLIYEQNNMSVSGVGQLCNNTNGTPWEIKWLIEDPKEAEILEPEQQSPPDVDSANETPEMETPKRGIETNPVVPE